MSQKQLDLVTFQVINYDIFAGFVTEKVNNLIENPVFPDSLKQPDIKPV